MNPLSGAAYTRCTNHPKERAAWRCTACTKVLCLDCAAAKSIQPSGEVIVCVGCNNMAVPLMRSRVLEPWWNAVVPFVRELFTMGGLTQLIALSIAVTVVSLFRPILGAGLLVTYLFQVIRSTARGQLKLPEPADFQGFSDIILPVLRLWVALSFLWLPALIYIVKVIGLKNLLFDPSLINDPVLYGIAIGGAFYVPAALITAAVAESVFAVLNPLITVRMILRIPVQYFVTSLMLFVIYGVNALANIVFAAVFGFWPLFGRFVAGFCGMFLPVIGAFILGRLIFQNAEHFGVLRANELEEPEWPDARPRGAIAHAVPIGAQQPVEVPELDALEESLRRGNDQGALDAFREKISGGVIPLLEPRWELRLATILERAGDAVEAARACERAAKSDLHGPLAPRAIFTAARLLVERAGQPVEGVRLYEYLIAHYPNDDFAVRAQDVLRKL